MSILDNGVLVLNSGWIPVDVTNVYDAVLKVCRNTPRALFVDPATYAVYDFEGWVDTWEEALRAAKLETDQVIETPSLAFRVPEVIVLRDYNGQGHGRRTNRSPKFSRRNVYLRDRSTCQYCGKRCKPEESNLDHVVPKSKGGDMSWHNIVVACVPCNDRKRNRTPEEAGMRLLRRPLVPRPADLQRPLGEILKRKLRARARPSWENFLGKMYWEVALKED